MKISVVVTTYNGVKYIIEQLTSIKNQTRVVDEVLIFDDCSTDNTVEAVNKFINDFQLLNWKIVINEKNVGWRRNFINGFHQATGDIIFCADQDDVWIDSKVEVMTKILEARSEISILASNMEVLFEDGVSPQKSHQSLDYGASYIEKVQFDKMWLEPWRPGCTMAFKKSILPWFDRIWFEECAHDLGLWALGIARGDAYIVNEKLIYYRRHNNVSTPSNQKKRSIRVGLMKIYVILSNQFIKNGKYLSIDAKILKNIFVMNDFYKKRLEAMEKKSVWKLICLLRYWNLYPKKTSWFADVISAYR